MLRQFLNKLYAFSGALAVLAVFFIAAFTMAQILGRMANTIVPSAGDWAAYSLAASSFLGLAYTLRKGEHIRVQLFLDRMGPITRRRVEVLSLIVANLLIGYITYHTFLKLYQTYIFGEYTLGLVPIPKWIPMCFMAFGVLVLFVALLDDLLMMLRGQSPSYFQVKNDRVSQA